MAEVIQLKGRLSPAEVKALHSDLLARKGRDLTLDLSALAEIGALTLQLLIAAGRHVTRNGNRLQLTNVSDDVLDQLTLLGISPKMITEAQNDA